MTNIEIKLIKPKLGVLELANQLGSVVRRSKQWDTHATAFTTLRCAMRTVANKRCLRSASYAQKLVTVRLGGVLKLLDPVLELNPLNDFWQSICAAELPPFLLG